MAGRSVALNELLVSVHCSRPFHDRCAITAEQGFFENIWSFINADDQIGTLFTRQA
jgi:hypothetical protein